MMHPLNVIFNHRVNIPDTLQPIGDRRVPKFNMISDVNQIVKMNGLRGLYMGFIPSIIPRLPACLGLSMDDKTFDESNLLNYLKFVIPLAILL
jgi:hypothetical protein